MEVKQKKYSFVIEHENPIVRDHRVHGVRVLPGVTFIDILYRLLASDHARSAVQLRNIVFHEPVVTSESFDKKVTVSMQQAVDSSRVSITSHKIKHNEVIPNGEDENVSCEIVKDNEVEMQRIDISSLKHRAVEVLDMEDVYAYVRRVDIQHRRFMKTLGTIYQGYDDVLMELTLDEEAKPLLKKFYLHPVFLDGATLAWVAARIKRFAFDTDFKPYIPLLIGGFRVFAPLTEACYVYLKLEKGALSEPQTDLSHSNITIYDPSGQPLAHFEELVAKKIRTTESILKLTEHAAIEPQILQSIASRSAVVPANNDGHDHVEVVAEPNCLAIPLTEPLAGKDEVRKRIEKDLQSVFAEALSRHVGNIPLNVAFFDIGLDSSQLLRLVAAFEKKLETRLYPTLLFEHSTISELARYFATEFPGKYPIEPNPVEAFTRQGTLPQAAQEIVQDSFPTEFIATVDRSSDRTAKGPFPQASTRAVAIVGVAGRYPQSPDLKIFWNNIVTKRNCITEIPRERWDVTPFFASNPLKDNSTYSRWGGFIEGADEFDASFFSSTPREAKALDPQVRLLLEVAWHTIEDAGYSPHTLHDRKVGVYIGAMNDDYTWLASERYTLTGQYESFGSYAHDLANRISYFMDFTGPSVTVETACSSSLTAIHMARQAILHGECDFALAGGVNLSLHRSKYMMLSQLGILSADGVERTFDERANGYVPGEGVGLVFLKHLEDAIEDRDYIYGVIKGSAINHSGRSAGKYVPSIKNLISVIDRAVSEAGIDVETIGYIETHGTGTALGDPIELKALANVFNKYTDKTGFCALGSRANLGHLESASGICALTKILLSMKHEKIPPCANVEAINPAISLEASPFYIPTKPKVWNRESNPRIAGVNSFGVGGSNSFLVVAEHVAERSYTFIPESSDIKALVVLSARTKQQLEASVSSLAAYLRERHTHESEPLAVPQLLDLAYSLQMGRQPMAEKLAVVAQDSSSLLKTLDRFLGKHATDPGARIFCGSDQGQGDPFSNDEEGTELVERWTRKGKLEKLAEIWVNGTAIDWWLLPENERRYRVPLPGYPFAKDRYYLPGVQTSSVSVPAATASIGDVLLFSPVWRETMAVESSTLPQGPILLLDTGQMLKLTLQNLLPKEQRLILVTPGKEFRQVSGDCFEIRPHNRDDYLTLIKSFKKTGDWPQLVIHRWCQGPFFEDIEALEGQLEMSFYSLLSLTQALMLDKSSHKVRLQCIYLRKPGSGQPLYAALMGFIKTVWAENPRFIYQLLEIVQDDEPLDQPAVHDLVKILLAEYANAADMPQEIRYEGGKRLSRCWEEIAARTDTTYALDNGNVALRNGGTYIISGGGGRLGLILAEHLVKTVNATVVLFGRSPLNEERTAHIEQISGKIQYLQADITDNASLEDAISRIAARFGPIHGVIHAAGVIRDSFIVNKELRVVLEVIAPKIHGTINLDLATRNQPLDFFIMFSSLASVLGNIGQADYSFANGFLDAYSSWRELMRKQGSRRGLTMSINWPFWDEGGMGMDEFVKARLRELVGLRPISTVQGVQVLNNSFKLERAQLAVATGELRKLRKTFAASALYTEHAIETDSVPKALDALQLQVENYLKEKIAGVTEIPVARLQSDTSFRDYGLDSLLAIKMLRELGGDFSSLPKSLFVEYNNIKEISLFIIRQYRDSVVARFGEGSVVVLPERETPEMSEPPISPKDDMHGQTPQQGVPSSSDIDGIHAMTHNDMSAYEQFTPENPMKLFNAGAIEKVDTACMACYPHDLLAMMNIKPAVLFNALHNGGLEPVFLRVYSTHLGRISQILLPMSQEDILEDTERRKTIFIKGFEMARDLGASIVSLQQTLPSATDYGRKVVEYIGNRTDLPGVSTGHSVTIAAVVMMIETILARTQRQLRHETVGVLGLGSIGAATLRLMLMSQPHPQRILLCDVYLKTEHLEEIKRQIIRELDFGGEVEILISNKGLPDRFYEATLIIGATNVPDVLDIAKVRPGTLIVDDSAPHCFNPQQAFQRLIARKDVIFAEGGLLRAPREIFHLRYAPKLDHLAPSEATPEDSRIFSGYTYEQTSHEILGCALAGLLNVRFSTDIGPTLGLVNNHQSHAAYRKLKQLGFQGADLRCRGVLLDQVIVTEFGEIYGSAKGPYSLESRSKVVVVPVGAD